jgi:NNP family nitrate/nitrite transporter-like MFS transporter
MHLRSFLRAGHWPTLLCAFLYFDISFMVWVLLGALANSIVPDLGLNEAERGLMLALPLLGGSILRLVLGTLTDHIGARRTGLLGLSLTVIPLLLGWLWADSYGEVLVVGLLLGVAGASFAAALPLASRWYPPQYQGMAMGIAGAGNSGTALATLFGPILAGLWGWHIVFGLALLPVLATLVLFLLLARDSPNQPAPRGLADYGAVLGQPDTWWFCLFYSVTFGGFVGFAVFLNSFFHVQYGLSKVEAGYFATACVIAGSFLRPVGGYLADRFGGIRMLVLLYAGAAAMMLGMAVLPPLAVGTVFMFLGMGLLGMGNGSVFQLVPQRFAREIGVITGIVGAAGGVGGFFLPILLGNLKEFTGTFAGGFLIFALLGLGCAAALLYVGRRWQGVFVGQGGRAASAVDTHLAGSAQPASADVAG